MLFFEAKEEQESPFSATANDAQLLTDLEAVEAAWGDTMLVIKPELGATTLLMVETVAMALVKAWRTAMMWIDRMACLSIDCGAS